MMSKYFLAILPPKNISNEIIKFQKELEEKFGSIHAQRVPPHITIVPPFECSEEVLIMPFLKEIQSFINNLNPIEVELINFQRFDFRTLFIDVKKNRPLDDFCRKLKLLFNQSRLVKQRVEKHYFVPHITIANKDLKKKDFKLAWQDYIIREYYRKFVFDEIVVLKHEEGVWNVFKCFQF